MNTNTLTRIVEAVEAPAISSIHLYVDDCYDDDRLLINGTVILDHPGNFFRTEEVNTWTTKIQTHLRAIPEIAYVDDVYFSGRFKRSDPSLKGTLYLSVDVRLQELT
jgi:hypothetical protein